MNKTALGLAIGAGALILGGGAALIIHIQHDDDHSYEIVSEAMADLLEEIETYSDPMTEETSWPQMVDLICSEDAAFHYSLNVSGLQITVPDTALDTLVGNEMISGFLPSPEELSQTLSSNTYGLDGTLQRDLTHHKALLTATVSVANKDLTDLTLQADGEDVALEIPLLTSRKLGCSAENLSEQVNGSVLAKTLGLTMPDGISVPLYVSLPVKVADLYAYQRMLGEALESYGTSFEAVSLEQQETMTLEDRSEVTASAYSVTWPKEEITLDLWIDTDGRIRRLVMENAMLGDYAVQEADMMLKGTDRLLDAVEGSAVLADEELGEVVLQAAAGYTLTRSDEYERTFSLDWETEKASRDVPQTGSVSYKCDGKITDQSIDAKAKIVLSGSAQEWKLAGRFAQAEEGAWQFIITGLRGLQDKEEFCKVTGTIGVQRLDREPDVDVSDRLMIFEADETQTSDLLAEVSGNVIAEVMKYVDALEYLNNMFSIFK